MNKKKKISSIIYGKSEKEEEEESRYMNVLTTGNEYCNKLNTTSFKRSNTTDIKKMKLKNYEKVSNALVTSPKEKKRIDLRNNEVAASKHCVSSIALKTINAELYPFEEENQLLQSSSLNITSHIDEGNSNTNTIDSNDIKLNIESNLKEYNHINNLFCVKTINYNEVLAYYSSLKFDKAQVKLQVENYSYHGWLQGLLMKCYNNYQLSPDLNVQREKLFVSTQIQYNLKSKFHKKMMNSIFNFLYQHHELSVIDNYNLEYISWCCKSNHTINETGIFGIIQIIALIDKFPSFTLNFYTYLQKRESEWAFGSLLLNITRMVVELLKSGVLIMYCNKNKNILTTINNFYFGMIYQIIKEISSQSRNILFVKKPITSSYISTILSDMKSFAQKNPGHFFWNTNELMKMYPSLLISNSTQQSTDNNNYRQTNLK